MQKLRNIGIIAHIDAGKTTLSERILFYSQKIHRMGEVHEGTATLDYLPEEQERGITITSACTTCQWQDYTINLIDTPGHVDFSIEVERSLRVLDGAVGVFCAVAGVQPQSETVWRQAKRFSVPMLAFINKVDRLGADFANALDSMQKRLAANPLPLNIPYIIDDAVYILDLIKEETLQFNATDQGKTINSRAWNENERNFAEKWREQALENLAENDEEFFALWAENNYDLNDIYKALRRGTLKQLFTPVFCGAALRNIGVQPLLDGICQFLPSPLDKPEIIAQDADGKKIPILADPKAPALGLVFKILLDEGRKLAFLRLYAGTLKVGDSLTNATGKVERISRIFRMHAHRREQLEEAHAGEIVGIVGLRSAYTGETWDATARKISLESLEIPPPVMTLALEARNADESKILDEALKRYMEEDPTFKAQIDEESGTRTISGMGELHLEIILERLQRELAIQPRVGHPQVTLRETISKSVSQKFEFDRQLGKERHQGIVSLSIEPLPRSQGEKINCNEQLLEPKLLPAIFVENALAGIKDALSYGETTGYPITDIGVTLENIERQEGITTPTGCRLAASMAIKAAVQEAKVKTLEPIMQLEISVPEDFLGATISLLGSCNGKIEEITDKQGLHLVQAKASMSKLFGFATHLRSATQGRASFNLTFSHFDTA